MVARPKVPRERHLTKEVVWMKTKSLVRFVFGVVIGLAIVLSGDTLALASQGPEKVAVSDADWKGEY